ncbi:hypothetical protein IQ215_04370 [Cyanobacterium stanieri LEGE 03274]|uniref:HTH marR-type domain-containing protein n=1 Tax=Cyanobacterium stanieri LEGE 03274 TaxID=1828756 RepID=A0ABR9V300_9CHRO|nr:hypothetical protein [Cyanobacterium stanieri]MBE9221926.1 hypothetical protein [Cyanobacterium stanieri LEGE 03274]
MGEKNLEKLYNLEKRAKKNLFVTGILTFLFSPFGYLYTNRYWAAAITFFIFFAMVEEPDFEDIWGVVAVGGTIENIISVRHARDKLAIAQSSQTGNNPLPFSLIQNQLPLSPPNNPQPQSLELQILKAIKKQGEMTVSDLIIATELSPTIVKETLLKLETEQLICGYNRHSDGAVVYKNI